MRTYSDIIELSKLLRLNNDCVSVNSSCETNENNLPPNKKNSTRYEKFAHKSHNFSDSLSHSDQIMSSSSSMASMGFSTSYSSSNSCSNTDQGSVPTTHSGCSSPSNVDDGSSQLLSSSNSSTSSMSSIFSNSNSSSVSNYSPVYGYSSNAASWPSVLFTPCLFPSLFEPSDYYYYFYPFHSNTYSTQNYSESVTDSKFEEMNQNVNEILGNSVNTAQSVIMNPWAREFKDITNSSSETTESSRSKSTSPSSRAYEKKWLQNNYTCFVPINGAASTLTSKKSSDSENKSNRIYVRNAMYLTRNQDEVVIGQQQQLDGYFAPNGSFYQPKKPYMSNHGKISVDGSFKSYYNSNKSTSGYKYAATSGTSHSYGKYSRNNDKEDVKSNLKTYHNYNHNGAANSAGAYKTSNNNGLPNKYRSGYFVPKTRS